MYLAHRRWLRVTLGLGLAAALTAGGGDMAVAHGKDLDIRLSPLTPDPEQPLVRLYTAMVRFAGDGDPLEGATVTMHAVRQEGDETIEVIPLNGVRNTPGLYVAEVQYKHFGTFDLTLRVEAAFGQGNGEVTFTDHVRPVVLTDVEQAAAQLEARRIFDLQTQFSFNWWPDVSNIVIRALHALAGVLYFASAAPASFAAWGVIGRPTPEWLRAVRHRYSLLMAASLVVLLAAGMYSAWFDAPVRPPGLFDPKAFARLPYGNWYLGVFVAKPVLFVGLAVAAEGIRRGLGQWSGALDKGDPGQIRLATVRLRWWTGANGALGLALIIDVAALVYLHYASHLGVFLR